MVSYTLSLFPLIWAVISDTMIADIAVNDTTYNEALLAYIFDDYFVIQLPTPNLNIFNSFHSAQLQNLNQHQLLIISPTTQTKTVSSFGSVRNSKRLNMNGIQI